MVKFVPYHQASQQGVVTWATDDIGRVPKWRPVEQGVGSDLWRFVGGSPVSFDTTLRLRVSG